MSFDYGKFRAYPTTYNGVRFRSRLEATWAAFFDQLGWSWEYEPIDLGSWSPDFMIKGAVRDALVEVKPSVTKDDDVVGKMMGAAGDGYVLLYCGLAPEKVAITRDYSFLNLSSSCCGSARPACWSQRTFCKIGNQYDMVFGHRGKYWFLISGNLHENDDGSLPVDEFVGDEVALLWAKAKNAVQWRRPR